MARPSAPWPWFPAGRRVRRERRSLKPVNRRRFLKISAAAAAGLAGGGTLYVAGRGSGPLEDHEKGTQKALDRRLGGGRAARLMEEIRAEHRSLVPAVPYIGGRGNPFTEWLICGAYYLAVYRALSAEGHNLEEAGRIIFETFQAMADHPEWVLRLVGRLKYNERYLKRLRKAAGESRKRRYPGDWVAAFVDGDGMAFDWGLDVTECGICKFYRTQGAEALAPYLCLSDYVVSEAFDRGLVRYRTLAEGDRLCDFRYKKGRKTYVFPLRDGWPPRFLSAA